MIFQGLVFIISLGHRTLRSLLGENVIPIPVGSAFLLYGSQEFDAVLIDRNFVSCLVRDLLPFEFALTPLRLTFHPPTGSFHRT